ncbi:MAG: glycoside hydrolase family 10 protein, partial [Pirellula sp.]
LSRDDWRRDQMNLFIKSLYERIKATKPHVKFGISPFGIWKPGYPESVQGFNQYEKLYADAKLWLNEGWCDYYSPQLYWPIHAKQQSFPALLQWWIGENTQGRVIAPGIFTSRVGDKNRPFTVEQIEDQVFLARTLEGSSGTIHFSMKAIMENREGLSDRLKSNTYLTPALTPITPWLNVEKVSAPKLTPRQPLDSNASRTVAWEVSNPKAVRRWAVYRLVQGKWELSILGPETQSLQIQPSSEPETRVQAIAVAGVDGTGALGPASILAINP